MGSFYPPSSVLVDEGWVRTQDVRNLRNGCGEIFKLAVVKSRYLFDLLLSHGPLLISTSFQSPPLISSKIFRTSIEVMLLELGPNLWESTLSRPVDYGHTFSKVIEMLPENNMMHGEAVALDSFFTLVLSHLRGTLTYTSLTSCRSCLEGLGLPVYSSLLTVENCWTALCDAKEHRGGRMRVPFVADVGEVVYFVDDVTEEELGRGIRWIKERGWDEEWEGGREDC
ncbi:hypothetical protein TrCOL_g5957 [Triparma columacea]|uniref:3-dehydroquinate synthase C-terminal domain-containing protein n=1 Tax=Triparma columacea TaxID=722753 RepID=A0A9W7LC07_9STRA|nr:hypothetical protein TrCOL_g5957 [Triparma columacea]